MIITITITITITIIILPHKTKVSAACDPFASGAATKTRAPPCGTCCGAMIRDTPKETGVYDLADPLIIN